MKLYFMRHGIATPKEDPASDRDRPLTDKGARRVRKIGKGLRRLGLDFDVILSSDLVRARQTAEIIGGLLHRESRIENLPSLAPESPSDRLIDELAGYQEPASVLLVGHEPSLSAAVGSLIGAKGTKGVNLEFKKGGLCRVDVEPPARAGAGTLIWLLTAKQLRLLGDAADR